MSGAVNDSPATEMRGSAMAFTTSANAAASTADYVLPHPRVNVQAYGVVIELLSPQVAKNELLLPMRVVDG